MKKMTFLLLMLFVVCAASVQSQVTIGTQNDPHSGAILDLQSTSKGLLLPNVSLSDVNILTVISSPTAAEKTSARGMVVYNTNTSVTGGSGLGIYVWDGVKWGPLSGGSQSTGLPGAPGTWVTVDPANPGDGTVGNPYKNVCPGTTVTLTPRSGYSFGTVTPSSAATVSGNSLVFNATGSVVVTKDGQSGTVYVAISSCGAPVIETNSIAGMVFMDRNLGASQTVEVKAPFTNNPMLFGDLYQWGRQTDGHEKRSSEVVTGPYAGGDPVTGQVPFNESGYYGKFIKNLVGQPYDWRSTQDNNLWNDSNNGKAGNPCPNGYRIPTSAEWYNVIHAAGITYTSGLSFPGTNFFLPTAGYRDYAGVVQTSGTPVGRYWSSTANGQYSGFLDFSSQVYDANGVASRANGYSIRCVKN